MSNILRARQDKHVAIDLTGAGEVPTIEVAVTPGGLPPAA
jgi:hypothetical protein